MGRKTKETTISERKLILNLHEQGKSYLEIGYIIKKSRFTVRSVIKRFFGKANLINATRSGRPQKLTDREKRKIVNIIKRDPKTTSSEVAAILKDECNVEVHPMTVRRSLRNAGYKSRVARRKPRISKINKRKD